MKYGIRRRILIAALAPTLLVAFLVSAMLVAEHVKQTHAEQHRRLAAVARQLTSAAEYSLFVGNNEGLRHLLDSALSEPDIIAGAFLDAQGQTLASTIPASQLPLPQQAQVGFSPSPSTEQLRHWHVLPIRPSGYAEFDLFDYDPAKEKPALGYLLIEVSNESLRRDMLYYAAQAAVTSLLMLIFGVLLALGLSRRLIKVLLRISAVVEQVGHGSTHERIEEVGEGELGRLAEGINRMVARVEINQAELATQVAQATQALRKEKEAAEAAALSRSRFFAAASHDLRQPMQALGLFVARLEREARRSVLLPRVNQIAAAVRNLQELLDALLDYSRLSGNVYRTDIHPVQATAVISAIHAEFAEVAAAKGITLRRRSADVWLLTDPNLLHRILLNLVNNAIRHTGHGGVLIACRRGGAGHARIDVWDTGPGIPPDQREAIFEELVQLDNPERDASKGIGLGLAIVRRTAELLAHPLRLYSRVGRGSCFSLTIPLAAPPATAAAGGENAAAAPEECILLIGERTPERESLVDLIEDWGHTLTIAATPGDALRWIAAQGAPSLVICETHGSIEQAEIQIDRLDTVACQPLPALLIHPGPLPQSSVRGKRRLLLARPFGPARLRALIDHFLAADEALEP